MLGIIVYQEAVDDIRANPEAKRNKHDDTERLVNDPRGGGTSFDPGSPLPDFL